MGASLSEGRVCDGKLVCPWHGLRFGDQPGAPGYRPLPTFDDGYLLWVQLPVLEQSRAGGWSRPAPSERPYLAARPRAAALDAVIRMEGTCEPRDVVANRLDPWHGAHYHPHSFARLRVIEQSDDAITVRVAYRVAGPFAMEVDARFHCPDPRSIVMTIVGGDGLGSVVETHATPISADRTAVIELTLADSDRPGFGLIKHLSGALRPAVQWAARRLWHEDLRYAERLFELRKRASTLQPTATDSVRASDAPRSVKP
jgi:isorenieratene synthase